ncbi:MAG TPA: WGxxGxxG family protein [Pyrinomonadaceae bacterium]
MKRTEAFKVLRSGALGLTLAALVSAAPAQAQNSNNNNSGRDVTTNRADDNRRVARDDDDRDWGWLGLLGLAGLLGLMPKKRVPVVVNETRDRDVRDPDSRDRR